MKQANQWASVESRIAYWNDRLASEQIVEHRVSIRKRIEELEIERATQVLNDEYGRVIFPLSIPLVRETLNALREQLATERSMAKMYHKGKYWAAWSYYMRICKETKRDIAILADYLHRLLVAKGLTQTYPNPDKRVEYTYETLHELCKPAFLRPQAN